MFQPRFKELRERIAFWICPWVRPVSLYEFLARSGLEPEKTIDFRSTGPIVLTETN